MELQYAHEHIELQLAHGNRNAVSAAYNHALHLQARAKMMQQWADFLEHTQRGTQVLQFRHSSGSTEIGLLAGVVSVLPVTRPKRQFEVHCRREGQGQYGDVVFLPKWLRSLCDALR